jgi:hypothetical protein
VTTVNDVEAKIDGHIDICALRYEGIGKELKNLDDRLEREMRAVNARLKRLEQVGLSVAGAIILLLVHLVTR